MGMFDYVTVPVEAQACPACGAKVDGFQSKDGDCRMAEPISWTECDRFYTSCRNCAAWIEYRRTPRPPPTSLAEFQCAVTTKAQLDAEREAFREERALRNVEFKRRYHASGYDAVPTEQHDPAQPPVADKE